MSDYLTDSPCVTRHWCPLCEPELDIYQVLVEEFWCSTHKSVPAGTDDEKIQGYISVSGNSESEGTTNKLMSDLLNAA